jgi:hypothetical protein
MSKILFTMLPADFNRAAYLPGRAPRRGVDAHLLRRPRGREPHRAVRGGFRSLDRSGS